MQFVLAELQCGVSTSPLSITVGEGAYVGGRAGGRNPSARRLSRVVGAITLPVIGAKRADPESRCAATGVRGLLLRSRPNGPQPGGCGPLRDRWRRSPSSRRGVLGGRAL